MTNAGEWPLHTHDEPTWVIKVQVAIPLGYIDLGTPQPSNTAANRQRRRRSTLWFSIRLSAAPAPRSRS